MVELLERNYQVVIVDDLSNSSREAVRRVGEIAGVEPAFADLAGAEAREAAPDPSLAFYEASILDRAALETIFTMHPVDVIIHFAGFKAVGESVERPLEYYWNNVAGTLALCDVARGHGCKNIVFSSSATVYGEDAPVPYTESLPRGATTNPYGTSKAMIEQILTDLFAGDGEWGVVLLRYFNPIGAHPSGRIGEDPRGVPNNLMPYVAQVAVGRRPAVGVFGDDYPTPDGTGVRDYIHLVDLVRGHAAALDWMAGRVGTGEPIGAGSVAGEPAADGTRRGVAVFNLGTGRGSSVLDVIRAFEAACGHKILYEVLPRRAGDIAAFWVDASKARDELGWTAEYDLARMCEDSWRWQSQNPDGYGDAE